MRALVVHCGTFFAKLAALHNSGDSMDVLAMPLASAAFFTLGCAILQRFRRYADHITPFLMCAVMILIAAILTVSSVQYQLAHGGNVEMFFSDPALALVP
ncbi:hypothetical protein [Methylobacterium sp. ID0610]|uniref:hypothetical protein n=1 Tax=Methylobacterium carpenticola TaxID=3344827 RepID=UPI0036A2A003